MVVLPILMSDLIYKIQHFIETYLLIKPHTTLVVGLSGGPDSVFLLIALKALQKNYTITLVVAHLDHEWRKESAQEALFCQELALKFDCPFVMQKASAIRLKKVYNGSREELGRHLRRQFLEETALSYNAEGIALAHHADDQQETFFIRLMRGASIAGLSSIRSSNGIYIRPLLSVHKTEILEYLHEQRISYLEDPTNKLDIYLRNAVRNNVIPVLRKTDNRFDKNFSKMVDHLRETDLFLDRLAHATFQEITVNRDGSLWLDSEKFFTVDAFLHDRLILLWLCQAGVPFTPSTTFFHEIIRFLQQPGSKTHAIHVGWKLIKKNGFACINQHKEL
jgi:tRNA(Ile)-lysidine synthase